MAQIFSAPSLLFTAAHDILSSMKIRLICVVLMVILIIPAWAVDIDIQLFRGGLLWQGQSQETDVTDGEANGIDVGEANGIAASQIITYAGAGVNFSFSDFLGFAPALDVYSDEMVYLEEYGRAFPTQKTTGSFTGPVAVLLVLNLNLPWYMQVDISGMTSFSLAAGPGLLFRIPVIPLDGTQSMAEISNYTLGSGRWLNFQLEPALDFQVNDWFGFSVGSKVILPIWHLWDGTDLPFWDTLSVGTMIRMNLLL